MNLGNLASAFVTTPGVGGIEITVIVTTAAIVYFFLIRWIMAGGSEPAKKK